MRRLSLLLLLTSLSTPVALLYAQTGNIVGAIYTSDSVPAAFVNVTIRHTNQGSTTNSQGIFEIRNVVAGTHTLLTSYVGLQGVSQPVTVVGGETTTIPDVTLQVNQATLQEVIVRGNRGGEYVADLPSRSLRVPGPLAETAQNIQVVTKKLLERSADH